jgi:7-cyano-7-deazaguanine synthase
MSDKWAVVLLSGGIDSATTLAVAIDEGFEIFAITFFYGQRHRVEIESARRLAEYFKVKNHLVVNIDSKIFSNSSLISCSPRDVPKHRISSSQDDIPTTYVPGRNILFLSYALSCAENLGSSNIFIGVNSVDYSGYPDCRPEFIEAYETMANLGTKSGITGEKFRIRAPLIYMKKPDIIKLGIELGVNYSLTHSCYAPSDGLACGACDSCLIRKRGFIEAGVPDPTRYVK